MGLVTPIELPELADLDPVHFIAIGGSGMNGIASMMVDAGLTVSGSDRQDSKYLQALGARGARVHVGHRAEQLGDARTVVASSAIRDDNPELAQARERGLRVLHRSAALGSLMLGRRGIAVAGTHGKTTTTAMLALVLTGCGFDPSFVIGGALTGSSTGGHLGGGEVMVVEADESDGSFLQYPAEVAVVTNVDPDHLSNWGTAGELRRRLPPLRHRRPAPAAGGQRRRPGRRRPDRAGPRERSRRPADRHLRRGRRTLTSGSSTSTLAGTGSPFELRPGRPRRPGDACRVPGHYNVLNAAAAYAVATALGADEAEVRRAAVAGTAAPTGDSS